MYECESWTIKKSQCQRFDAFEPWCWRWLLKVPGTGRRSIQSILKEISPECSLEGLMLKLKLQYFGQLIRRTDSSEKTQMFRKIEGSRRRGRQRMTWLDGTQDWRTWVSRRLMSCWWTGKAGVQKSMGSKSWWGDRTEGNHWPISRGENAVEVWTKNSRERSTQGFGSRPKGSHGGYVSD